MLPLLSCGTLDDKTILINAGDSKEDVLSILGTPQDRQFKGSNEAWQYCVSGAGFGAFNFLSITGLPLLSNHPSLVSVVSVTPLYCLTLFATN